MKQLVADTQNTEFGANEKTLNRSDIPFKIQFLHFKSRKGKTDPLSFPALVLLK